MYDTKEKTRVLADGARWIECWPMDLKVAGSIPSQGTSLGCGTGPRSGAHERHPIDVSLPLFLPPFLLSLKINLKNIFLGKKKTDLTF